MTIYIDADACPVKDEIMRVAERHGLTAVFVSNSGMRLPRAPFLQNVVVPDGPDVADDWIAERAVAGDIVVTADIPLAARCLKSGADVIGTTGKPFDKTAIGMALAMRELKQHLRETGDGGSYNRPFGREDRSRFLQALDAAVQRGKRGAHG